MSDAIINHIVNAPYKFAKTMKRLPHSYTLKEEWDNKKNFEDAVRYIRENGRIERFFRTTFIYFYHDGYKYWTMGNPVSETILINRAAVD